MKFSKPLKNIWHITVYFGELLWYGRHKGLDLRVRDKHFPTGIGMPLYAPADGTIVQQSWDNRAGNVLVLDHREGWTTRYYHLSEFVLQAGAQVKEGDLIGHCGDTGAWVTGAHLHWEVRKNNVPVNPLLHLKEDEGGEEDILKKLNMTYEELYDKVANDLIKNGFMRKRPEIKQDDKTGAVYQINDEKKVKYQIPTQEDDIAMLAAFNASSFLTKDQKLYKTVSERKDVF